ncbi:MAG: HDOD domain-containing protein [Burkholderiales bacterium]
MISAAELVAGVATLASLPTVYLRVKEVVEDPQSSLVDLTKVIATDPGLTARMLRIVNSPFYGHAGKVETVSRALNILGTQQVHDLVLATAVIRVFAGGSPTLMNIEAFWRASLYRALLARTLAKRCDILDSERLFLEGLLSDIGHLVMYDRIPDLAASALRVSRQDKAPLFRVERELIGCDYAQVGAELMRVWRLPGSIESTVRHHPEPCLANTAVFETSLVHIAALIAAAADTGEAVDTWILPIEPFAWEQTKLSAECYAAVKRQSDAEISAATNAFHPTSAAAA